MMALPFPDLRHEMARDHLLQALAILPAEGSEVIRLLVEEAARRCEDKAYRTNARMVFGPPDPPDLPTR